MTKSIHPVPAVEEGPAGPAIHPQLFISRTDDALEVSALPRPEASTILASTIFFSGIMLLLGSGGTAILVLRSREQQWPLLIVITIGTFCLLSIVLGLLTLASVPLNIWHECSHEVLEIQPEEYTIRRTLNGLTLWAVKGRRGDILSVRHESVRQWDGSTRSQCVISEEGRRHAICRRLPAQAVQHVAAVLAEFLKVDPTPEAVIIPHPT